MNEHLKTSEIELNELLAEYWKLRHETGKEFIYHVRNSRPLKRLQTADIYMETLANKLNLRVTSE